MAQIEIFALGEGALVSLPPELQQGTVWVSDAATQARLEALAPTIQLSPLAGEDPASQAAALVALAGQQDALCYVYGGPLWPIAPTVRAIVAACREGGVDVRLHGGEGFLERLVVLLGLPALDAALLQLVAADAVAAAHTPLFDPGRPALLMGLDSPERAKRLQQVLLTLYPADHPVTVLALRGTHAETITSLPLHQLDQHAPWDGLTLFLPPLAPAGSLVSLREVFAHLRAPEGCPWDKVQTYQTLRVSIQEEAAEVLSAIDGNDPEALREELGDLLGNTVMLAQVATEAGDFTLHDVIASIGTKLVRRHPHVFGDEEVMTVSDLMQTWERVKAEEQAEKGQATVSPFASIPTSLASLARAQKVAKRGRKAGGPTLDPAAAWAAWQADPSDATLGPLLMALATTSDDPESALRETIAGYVATVEMRLGGEGAPQPHS